MRSAATAGLLAGTVWWAALAVAAAPPVDVRTTVRPQAPHAPTRSSSIRPPRVKPPIGSMPRAGPPVPKRKPAPPADRAAAVPQPKPKPTIYGSPPPLEPPPRAAIASAAPPLRTAVAPPDLGTATARKREAPEQDARAPRAAPMRTAAVPPAPKRGHEDSRIFGAGSHYRLGFASDTSKLDTRAGRTLDRVVDGLKSDGRLRLQLLAYAGGRDSTARESRRLSLTRALSVRSYLIDKGVRSTRIDIRALGSRYQDGPPDRVDVVVTRR